MPPKSRQSASRKQTSSIANAFRPQAKSSARPPAGVAAGKAAAKQAPITSTLTKSKETSTAPSRSASPEKRTKTDGEGLTKDELQNATSLPHLDVQDRRWDGIWRHVKQDKLGKVGASELCNIDGKCLIAVVSDPPFPSPYDSSRGRSESHPPYSQKFRPRSDVWTLSRYDTDGEVETS